MAVPEQTPYIEHTGNGVATSFSLGFQCESKDHLIVLVDEIEPPIATWSLTGGNVIFTAAPASGSKITLQRNTPFGRTADYHSFNNSFRPQSVNGDFDRLWLKLQELGVADWLMKLYVDRLHQQQEEKIDDLKGYVDDRDNELRAYLMEEIRKQGVALDQLDEYYNYLMQRLAQIAVDKGWDASFVVDGDKNQHEINEEQKAQNNSFKSKIRKTPYDFGAKGGDNDDTAAVKACIESGYFLINDAHKCQPFTISGKTLDGEFNPNGKLIFTQTNANSITFESCKGIVRNPVIDDVDGVGGTYKTWRVYKCKGFSAYNLTIVGGKETPVSIEESDWCFVIDSGQDNTGMWRFFGWQIYNSRACQFVRCNLVYSQFGILLIGPSYKSGVVTPTTRSLKECVGMKAVDCTLTNTTNTCFDINGAVGAEFVGCTADQQGQSLASPGFQIKQSTLVPEEDRLGTYMNKVTDCTAINCAYSIGFKEGHASKVTNFTSIDSLGGVVSFSRSPRVEIDGLYVFDFGLNPTAYTSSGIADLLAILNSSGNVVVRNVNVTMTNNSVDGSKIRMVNNESNNVTIDGVQVNLVATTPTYNTFLRNTGSFLKLLGSIRMFDTERYTTPVDDTATSTVYPVLISKVIDLVEPTEIIHFDQIQSNGIVVGKVATTSIDLSGSDAQVSVGVSGNVAGLRGLAAISAGTSVGNPVNIKSITGGTPILARREAGTTGTGKVLIQVRGFELL